MELKRLSHKHGPRVPRVCRLLDYSSMYGSEFMFFFFPKRLGYCDCWLFAKSNVYVYGWQGEGGGGENVYQAFLKPEGKFNILKIIILPNYFKNYNNITNEALL